MRCDFSSIFEEILFAQEMGEKSSKWLSHLLMKDNALSYLHDFGDSSEA